MLGLVYVLELLALRNSEEIGTSSSCRPCQPIRCVNPGSLSAVRPRFCLVLPSSPDDANLSSSDPFGNPEDSRYLSRLLCSSSPDRRCNGSVSKSDESLPSPAHLQSWSFFAAIVSPDESGVKAFFAIACSIGPIFFVAVGAWRVQDVVLRCCFVGIFLAHCFAFSELTGINFWCPYFLELTFNKRSMFLVAF